MPGQRALKAPQHLSAATREWWLAVHQDFALEGHHTRLLTLACEAWDTSVRARAALDQHGLVYVDRLGTPKPRPEWSVERDSKLLFSRLLRELRLDISPPEEARIPPLNGGRAHA